MSNPASPLPPEGTADLPHYVSPEPFDARSIERLTPEQEKIYFASQLTLMWWKFKRHRVAVWSGWIILKIEMTSAAWCLYLNYVLR